MRHETLICLDIETVPDPDLVPADWPVDKFVTKAIWHRVVAISFVEASILREPSGTERYEVRCCRSGGEPGWDERRLLQAFWRYFGELRPRVVSWNGRSFDMPVLRLRAFMYGIPADPWYTLGDRWSGYTQRFAQEWHCDLMEQLADHGAATKLGMQDVAVAVGLPGKFGGHGSEVSDMIARGETGAVRAYCEGDVINLFALYVRWALLTGRTDPAGHDAGMESLAGCLESGRALHPHFGEFLDLWKRSERPVPSTVVLARVPKIPGAGAGAA